MGGGKISDVQDEHHPLAILLRVPLIDLKIQIEVCGIANLLWKDCKDLVPFDTGIDGSDSENFCGPGLTEVTSRSFSVLAATKATQVNCSCTPPPARRGSSPVSV